MSEYFGGNVMGTMFNAPASAPRGWYWPSSAMVAHFFDTARGITSLCGKWRIPSGHFSMLHDADHSRKTNCKKCRVEHQRRYPAKEA